MYLYAWGLSIVELIAVILLVAGIYYLIKFIIKLVRKQ